MEIHFDNIKENIIENLKSAKFNIYASVAWIGENFIIQELTNCLKRGIQVEIIVNDDERFQAYKQKFINFLELGGKLYLYDTSTSLMHNKFCVVDLCTTITGSFNWTHGASFHRENIIIERRNIEVAHAFALEFLSLKQNSTLFYNEKSGNVELAHKVNVSSSFISDGDNEKFVVLELTEGNRVGYLNLNSIPPIIPDKIHGFWKGKYSLEEPGGKEIHKDHRGKEYYEFICIDPEYINYV